jgi:hypothetical protein
MAHRVWITVAVAAAMSAACGSSSPLAPTVPDAQVSVLRGATVSAVDGQPIAGVTVRVGSRNAVSNASGSFQVDNIPSGSQDIVLSGPAVFERHTSVVTPTDNVTQQALIPSDFDMATFDQMFRASGRLERWTTAPPLVVLTSVLNYENGFGDSPDYHATSEQLTDAEVDLLIAQLTDALALLTGNTYTSFASVERESPAAGSIVKTLRTGKLLVGRYRGIQTTANTIGLGGHVTNDKGEVNTGSIYLDRDFDRSSEQRRLLRTHELGHALGYAHVTTRVSIMNPVIGPEPSAFDRLAAIVAFQRAPGNQSPDSDSTAPPARNTGGIFTIAK